MDVGVHGKGGLVAEAQKHTLAEVVERYCKSVTPGKKSGAKQERILKRWAKDLGETRLSGLTPAVLAEYRDKLAAEKGMVVPA